MNTQKGFAPILIILGIIIGFLVISGTVIFLNTTSNQNLEQNPNKPIVSKVKFTAPSGKVLGGYIVDFKTDTDPSIEYKVILRNKLLPLFGDEDKSADYDSESLSKYLLNTDIENYKIDEGVPTQPLFF